MASFDICNWSFAIAACRVRRFKFGFKPGLLIGAVIIIGLGMVIRVSVLTIRLPREDDRIVAVRRVNAGDVLMLAYRHSVELTAVEGRFEIGQDNQLLALETRMASVGTGLPNASPERTRREGEWIVVDEGRRVVDAFRFFLQPVNQTRITVNSIPLAMPNIKPGALIVIDLERISWNRCLFWKTANILRMPANDSDPR